MAEPGYRQYQRLRRIRVRGSFVRYSGSRSGHHNDGNWQYGGRHEGMQLRAGSDVGNDFVVMDQEGR